MYGSHYVVCFLLSALTHGATAVSSILTIGAVTDGNASEPSVHETIVRMDLSTHVIWHQVDMREMFQVLNTVRALNMEGTVDTILIVHYIPPVPPTLEQILASTKKPVIRWGDKPQIDEMIPDVKKKTFVHEDDLCKDDAFPNVADLSELFSDDPNCLGELNTTSLISDYNMTGNQTGTINAPQIVASLVKTLKWKVVFVLHENSTEEEASDMLGIFSDNDVMFALYNIDRGGDLNTFLQDTYDSEVILGAEAVINFVVLCHFECARKVLRQANIFDYNKGRKTVLKQISRWLVTIYGQTSGVTSVLKSCANDLDNVVVIAFPQFKGGDQENLKSSIESMLYEFQNPATNYENVSLTKLAISTLQERAKRWNPVINCKGFKIDTLLWRSNKRREFSAVGYAEPDGGVVLSSDLFPNTKYGFNKRTFNISTLSYDPFVMRKEANGKVEYSGFCMDLLKELSFLLNFTYTITEPADGKWGSVYENGSWNGLIGQLEREEVDLVVAPISVQPERQLVMDFSYPFYYDYTSIMVKQPDPNATKWRKLIDPFHPIVLVSICACLPVITFIVFLMEKYNPFYETLSHAEDREQNGGLHTFMDAFWYMFGALLCQGGVHLPDSFAGRTIVSFWWIFSIIIVGIYSGNLIAFLTVEKNELAFSTIEEMVTLKDEYKWGTLGGTYWEVVFTTSTISVYEAIGQGIREFSLNDPAITSTSTSVHIDRVKQGGYVWIGDKTTIELTLAKECELLTTDDEFLPMRYAIGLPLKSPHTNLFSNEMISIHESGLIQIWKRQWWPKSTLCTKASTTKAKQIELADVQSAFYLIGAGIALASIVFVGEVILFYVRRKRAKERPPTTKEVLKNLRQNVYHRETRFIGDGNTQAWQRNGSVKSNMSNGHCVKDNGVIDYAL